MTNNIISSKNQKSYSYSKIDEQNKSIIKFKGFKKMNDNYSELLHFYNNTNEYECCVCFSNNLDNICPFCYMHISYAY